MNFAALYLTLDFDDMLSGNDRSFILRACKEKILSRFKRKCAIQSSLEDSALLIISLDNKLEKLKSTCKQVLEYFDSIGEARILNHSIQYFSCFEKSFFEINANTNHKKIRESKSEPQTMRDNMKTLIRTSITKRRLKSTTRKI